MLSVTAAVSGQPNIQVAVVRCERLGTGIWMEPERKVSHCGGRAFLPSRRPTPQVRQNRRRSTGFAFQFQLPI